MALEPRMDGQRNPGIFLSLPPRCCHYKPVLPHPAFLYSLWESNLGPNTLSTELSPYPIY